MLDIPFCEPNGSKSRLTGCQRSIKFGLFTRINSHAFDAGLLVAQANVRPIYRVFASPQIPMLSRENERWNLQDAFPRVDGRADKFPPPLVSFIVDFYLIYYC